MKFKNNIVLMLLLTTPSLTMIANTEPPTNNEETAVEEVDEILTNEEIIQLAQLAEEMEAAEKEEVAENAEVETTPDFEEFKEKLKKLNKEWFVKNELFVKPANKYNKLTKAIKWLPAIAAGVTPVAMGIKEIRKRNARRAAKIETPMTRLHRNISMVDPDVPSLLSSLLSKNNIILGATSAGGLLIGYITYKLLKRFVSKPINFRRNKCEAFETFIQNWDQNKASTPESLHEFFDLISEEYKKQENPKKFIKMFVNDTMKKVKNNFAQGSPFLKVISIINGCSFLAAITISFMLGLIYCTD